MDDDDYGNPAGAWLLVGLLLLTFWLGVIALFVWGAP